MDALSYLRPWLAVWAAAGVAFAQQTAEPPILSVTTDLVTVPVTVVDRRGAFVTGLRRDDFKVYDSGELQTIQFFTSEDIPATIGLVIDSSGSMGGRRGDVMAAATAFMAVSHPLGEFFSVHFNEAVWPGLPPDRPFTADAGELRAALAAAPARGMTALYDAVDRALEHLQQGTRDRKALILVSDGGDNASSRPLEAVLEHARRTNAVIYAVTLFERDNRDARPQVLRKLARETGGLAFAPRRAGEITEAFARIARDIRSGYMIGFVPADTSLAGFRPIRVVADAGDGRRLAVRARAGYYAGGSDEAR